jgi:hypothetical protein
LFWLLNPGHCFARTRSPSPSWKKNAPQRTLIPGNHSQAVPLTKARQDAIARVEANFVSFVLQLTIGCGFRNEIRVLATQRLSAEKTENISALEKNHSKPIKSPATNKFLSRKNRLAVLHHILSPHCQKG